MRIRNIISWKQSISLNCMEWHSYEFDFLINKSETAIFVLYIYILNWKSFVWSTSFAQCLCGALYELIVWYSLNLHSIRNNVTMPSWNSFDKLTQATKKKKKKRERKKQHQCLNQCYCAGRFAIETSTKCNR